MTQIEKKRKELQEIRRMDKAQGKTRYFYRFTYQEVIPSKGISSGILTAHYDKAYTRKPDITEVAEEIEASFLGLKKILSVKER
jgi:hypothetical protein